jgi:hypothetical protein
MGINHILVPIQNLALTKHLNGENMTLLNAFEVPTRDGILWHQQNERKYRFKRKDGGIYLDLVTNLKHVGSSLDILVLQHFQFAASLFNMPYQNWVLLAFVDPDDVVSIGYLNSGSTDATRAWDAYVLNLQTEGIPLASVVTTVSLQQEFSKTTGNTWFTYKFEYRPRKTKEEKAQFDRAKEFMLSFSPILIDRNLDREIATQLFATATGTTVEALTEGTQIPAISASDANASLFTD